MKRITSIFRRNSISLFILAFIILPLGFLFNPMKIETSMLSLLPSDKNNIIKQKAFEHLSKNNSQDIILLFGHENKNEAYRAAKYFHDNLNNNEFIKAVNFEIDKKEGGNIVDFYHPYRNQLLSREFAFLLSNNDGYVIQRRAVRNLFLDKKPLIVTDVSQDPFLLLNSFFDQLHFFETPLIPHKNILVSKYQNKYYAFSSINLKDGVPFSVKKIKSVIDDVNRAQKMTENNFNDVEIINTGAPVHSNKSNQNSIKEINIISLISVLLIFALVYINFKSTKPFFFILFSIAAGFIGAFSVTNFIFKEIHLLTIIFGTSLIGVSIDYSFHFFAEYFNKDSKNNLGILRRILPGITIGLLTSLIGYVALFLTPFMVLQQIACFSIVGLIISYLAIILLFPKLYKPKTIIYKSAFLSFAKSFLHRFQNRISKKGAFVILLILLSLSLIGLYKITINDDVKILYSSPQKLINEENLARKILGQDKAHKFIIVTGESEQIVLEKELMVTRYLEKLVEIKNISSYQALSTLVPPIRQQKYNLELVKSSLFDLHLRKQAATLRMNRFQLEDLTNDLHKKPNYLEIKDVLNNKNLNVAKSLWLGKVGDEFSSIILLKGIVNDDFLVALNSPKYGVYLIDKKQDVADIFQEYRDVAFLLLIGVYCLIFLLLIVRYGFVHSVFVSLPPLLSGISAMALIVFLGYEINLFNILALFLIIGIGIDYTIFYAEAKKHEDTTSLAILLSSITTLLSFGLLSLSSFPLVHSFGLIVLFGILFSYLLSPMATIGKK